MDSKPSDVNGITKNGIEKNVDDDVEYPSKKRRGFFFGTGFMQFWAALHMFFVMFLEKCFEKSAMFISRRPFVVIFVCLFLGITLTSGFAKLEVEQSVKYLFLPEGSEASLDIRKARNLGFELELRQEEVIVLPKHNDSLLSEKCLAEMIDLHYIITKKKPYNQHCFRSSPNSSCASINLLEVFEYEKKNLINASKHIETVLKNNAFLMSNKRRLQDNFNQIFGKATSNSSLQFANALRSVYFMNEYPRGTEDKESILEWEKMFLNDVSSFAENTKCVNIVYAAERSLDDSVAESTASDIKLFAMTFAVMGIFSGIVNGRCADVRFGHQLLGFSSLFSIYLGVTAALGFLMIVGVPFVSMVGILPFLVVSIGIDDVFIILHNLNEMVHQNIPAIHMLSGTMAKSGPTITMTTLTDLVAFAVSCRSIFPAIRIFCTYAALTIWSVFSLLVTLFVGFTWFDIKRINAQRRDFLPCLRSPNPTERCSGIRANGLSNIMKAWGSAITSSPGKVIVCLCSLFLLSGGIYGALNINESFNRQLLTAKDSHFRHYLNVFEEHFSLNIEVSIIFPGQVDHSSQEIQKLYSKVKKHAKSNRYFISESVSWLSEYVSWAKEKHININDTSIFYQRLQHFISLPKYKRFSQDLKFSENKTYLTASRLLLYSKSSTDSIFQRDMMISIRKDLSRSTNYNAFAVALPFLYFEQYAHVVDETIRNVIVAGISILFISSMFLNHFVIVICLLFGFVALILELLGLMYIWNISINSLSMINLVMALGFSVDYSAHVAFHFVTSKASSLELRVIDSLNNIGGSVFLGGLSTFLGMMPTGFSSSTIFQTFFKMFVGIVVLGLFHGLAILPVYLTLLGKIFDFSEMDIDPFILKLFKRIRKHKSKKVKDVNSSQECVVKGTKSTPAAVVGIACRFSGGANSKDAFWDMLVEGRSGFGSYPTDRPNSREFMNCYSPGRNTPGKHHVLTGCYLDNITGFDAEFFKISPAECRSMDPQQRKLLQVVYEAIEDAGIRLEDLQKCRTGVYVGLMNAEFGTLLLQTSNIRNIDQFCSTGIATSIAANRISFALNLTGPSLTLDTACSSALVAFDVAFAHLHTGQCDVAIVCAPNILLTGYQYQIACCKTGLLADDGRCKSFDITGDGYGRGEGVAAVVIKPTVTALEDQDDIYAEVVACGVNNDGKTAIPMTAPSEITQAALFERVLQESGLSKDDVQYVEAHGTGTAVGDVVEMGSLATVYGNSSNRILRLGSVKSNINHTESTAGLAGLIKTCLMIKRCQFVPTINVHEVKPQLKMSDRRMIVQICNEPWHTEDAKPRTAAVSSYGFGGTNAHIIVREAKKPAVTETSRRNISNRVMTLSAVSKDALKAMAKKVSLFLKDKPDDDNLLKDNICYSLNERYTVHSHRLAISFSSFKDATKALEKFADQENGYEELVAYGVVKATRNKVAFVYGGQGAQWFGMAKEMLIHEPKFKESIEKIDALLIRYKASWSLITELNKPEETSRLHENPIGQTALFAIHFALTELMKSWGVTPSAVVGHSLGEISAAWASGALQLHKALQLVLFRSQLHEKCSPTGCMAAIGLSEEDARNMLQKLELENEVDVAAVNSPGNVVLSGGKASMDVVENHVVSSRNDIFWRKLTTTRAYHSREMEEIKQSYFKLTDEFNVRQTQSNIPFYSTVTGSQLSGQLLSLEHWWKNIRKAVLLESALKTMFSDGYQLFIEVNASPQLSSHIRRTWSQNQTSNFLSENEATVVQTLPKRSASQQHLSFLQNCVAHLFTNGVLLSWNKVQGSGSKTFIPRPTYPWQETEFWYRDEHPPEFVTFLDEQNTEKNKGVTTSHPLLGKAVPTATFTGIHAWESELSLYKVPYISDHMLAESSDPVIPAAVYVEMILAMSQHLSPNAAPDVHNISFDNLLTISENDSHRMRTRLLPEECPGGQYPFQITIVNNNEKEVVLSEGSIQLGVNDEYKSEEPTQQENQSDIEVFKTTMSKLPENFLQKIAERKGFVFGAQFSLIREAWSNGVTEALALICPTKEIMNEASAYVVHPSVIDACFQAMLLVKDLKGKFLPKKISQVTIVQKPACAEQFYAHIKMIESEETPTYNITLMDRYAKLIMIFEKYITTDISRDKAKVTFENSAFAFNWQKVTSGISAANTSNVWLILKDQNTFAEQLLQHIPAKERVHLFDNTFDHFPKFIDEVLSKLKNDEKLLVINLLPVDCCKYDSESHNFDPTNGLAFESCLSISQEILKREAFSKNIHLVFVTADVVTIPQQHRNPTLTSDAFPWSSSVFGFRRSFTEEITAPKAFLVDLSLNPSDDDFGNMIEDLRKLTIEEEVVYRNGIRYVNRITELHRGRNKFTKQTPPITKDGERKPFKFTSMSEQWFLQETSYQQLEEIIKIEVHFACPIFEKPWKDLKTDDRVTFAGKLFDGDKGRQDPLVVGICKIDDLESYVKAEKCCFTSIECDFTAQQAASLCFPLAMSYHILQNLVGNVQGKNVLFYNRSEKACCIFACVAMSLDINVICVAKNKSSKDRMKKFGNFTVISEDEIKAAEQNDGCMNFDAVCLFNKNNTYVTRQVMKQLKPGAKVITVGGEDKTKFNQYLHGEDVHCIKTNLKSITENSKDFTMLLGSCCSVLKSRKLLEKLLSIPQLVSSVYDVMENESNTTTSDLEKQKSIVLKAVSFRPENVRDKVVFYNLPLDGNGFKHDRTYLVVGGVRGFGFEVAKWMVENGAKTIMCTSRSEPNERKKTDVQQLEQNTGSRVLLRQADVTSWKDMNVIKEELERLPAVAGIIFTAMVLEDQLVSEADFKTCKKVMETKIKGSVILHQLSLSMELDFFVMFSSISSVLGNVGQVAYSSANSFMDHLCEYRQHKLGLPALSLNWGPISGAGILERNTNIASNIAKHGFHLLHYKTANEFLKRVLLENSIYAQICLAPINWQVYLQNHTSSRLQMIRKKSQVSNEQNKTMTLEELAPQPIEFRVQHVQKFIKQLLSSWSGADVAEFDLNVGLINYGIDSIAASNMKLKIKNTIGAKFETFYFLQPKTSGLTIINDILQQIEDISKSCGESGSTEETGQSTNVSLDVIKSESDFEPATLIIENVGATKRSDEHELQLVENVTNREKVVPFYTPDDAVVKVFMIHGSQKSALSLASFALGFQQQTHVSLYGIGVDDTSYEKSEYGSVLTLAQKYVNFIRNIQPRGPYYLAGYSFGGMVAYEMASQLRGNDETVAMVFMVDTYAWFPKFMPNCNAYIKKHAELNLKSRQKLVTKQVIEKLAFVVLGLTKNEVENLYKELGNSEKVIAALQDQAMQKNLPFPLEENVETIQYELRSAGHAHNNWQPPKICYDETLTYITCDDSRNVLIWGPKMWMSLVKRVDFLYVSGSHLELRDETRGKICGSMMMTTAAMKYQSTFPTFKLQTVRSKPQERLVEFLKQGLSIWMLSNPSSSKLMKGTLVLDSEEMVLNFEYESLGRSKMTKIFLKELSNVLPGRHVAAIQKHHGNKSHINLLICMISNQGKLFTFRCKDLQQLQQLTDALGALFGIPFKI